MKSRQIFPFCLAGVTILTLAFQVSCRNTAHNSEIQPVNIESVVNTNPAPAADLLFSLNTSDLLHQETFPTAQTEYVLQCPQNWKLNRQHLTSGNAWPARLELLPEQNSLLLESNDFIVIYNQQPLPSNQIYRLEIMAEGEGTIKPFLYTYGDKNAIIPFEELEFPAADRCSTISLDLTARSDAATRFAIGFRGKLIIRSLNLFSDDFQAAIQK